MPTRRHRSAGRPLRRRADGTGTPRSKALPKSPTGIRGLDEITGGGLPTGRPTLVCGEAGSGKTLLAMEFLVRGVQDYGEPGVFIAFEETAEELSQNVLSLDFDLLALTAENKLVVDCIRIERSEIEEAGEYDLEGLFVRLNHAIERVSARRIVLDTLEALFSHLNNTSILRAEMRRLFRWLKLKGITALITGERGEGSLARHGIEEYVSDCVIALDHRLLNQVSTRRLRVVKYRGSRHGTNEYPFLIDDQGIHVLPITSMGLQYAASNARISSGIPGLDAMLSGGGFFRGSTVLVSGTTGSGKTSIAANFVAAACQRGERCLHFLFEESASQLLRNMRSIGLQLKPHIRNGLLLFHASRPSQRGLEAHLVAMVEEIRRFAPSVVVVDPISSFTEFDPRLEIKSMFMRLLDVLKDMGITAMLINLSGDTVSPDNTSIQLSSLIDTWVLLQNLEASGERTRSLSVLKSRGMAHSNQIREFRLTPRGIELSNVYVGPNGILTGIARKEQEALESARSLAAQQDAERQQRMLQHKRKVLESRIAALRNEFAIEKMEADRLVREAQDRAAQLRRAREGMSRSGHTDKAARVETSRIGDQEGTT